MKCNKCNAEWQVDASRSSSITVCPFCQEKIVAEKTGDWKYFDNTKELLVFIAAEYGNDALFGRKYFSDHSAPLMPQGQKNLVKQAFDCGAVKILQDNMDVDQQRREIAVKQAVGKLVDTYASAKESAVRVVWEVTNAIGWGMPEPTESAPSPPQFQPQPRTTPTTQPVASGIDPLMTRAWQFAEDSDWKEAADYFNKVLDIDPSYAPAFLGLLCVDLKASQEDKLANAEKPTDISNHKYYKRAITDPAIKTQLDGYLQTINARIDEERKAAEEAARKKRVQDAFDDAAKIMNSAQSPDDYRKAISAFGNIDSNYQDINNQIQSKISECERKKAALEAEVQKKYGFLLDRFSAESRAQAGQRRQVAQAQLDEENAKAKAAVDAKCAELQQQYDADYKTWQEKVQPLKTQYDTAYRTWEEETNKAKSQYAAWKTQGLCPHCGGTLKGLLLKKCADCGKSPSESINTLAAPPTQPNYPAEPQKPQMPTFEPRRLDPAVNAENSDIEAYIKGNAVFLKSDGVVWHVYDAKSGKALLRSDDGTKAYFEGETIKRDISVGEVISLSNIEWRVLEIQGSKALLISEKILELRPYNAENEPVTWETCSLRKYLNGEFLNKLGEVKSAIAETRNTNPNNPWYGTAGGNATMDKVFLLSLDELVKYFGDSGDLVNKRRKNYDRNPKSDGKDVYDQYDSARMVTYGNEASSWWLRSPGGYYSAALDNGINNPIVSGSGLYSIHATNVCDDGGVNIGGALVDTVYSGFGGVRPALWLNL